MDHDHKKNLITLIVTLTLALVVFTTQHNDLFSPQSILALISTSAQPGNFSLNTPITRCANQNPEIILSWTASPDATSYTLQRKLVNETKYAAVTNDIKDTTIVDTVTSTATTYTYRIQAHNGYAQTVSNEEVIFSPACASVSDATPPTSSISKAERGVYAGWRDEDFANFEKKIGKSMNDRAIFINWGGQTEFPVDLAKSIGDKGKTLVIFWQALDSNASSPLQPNFSYDAIIRGDWDLYISNFAEDAFAYGGPVILVPFEEMNSDWSPWSGTQNNNSPAKHIEAYRHIRALFKDISNVKFGWDVSTSPTPDIQANRFENYYPGDEYIDYVGVSGFNFGSPWESFGTIFNNTLNRLKAYRKPIYIFSFATADGPYKAGWITDALTVELPKNPEIKGWIWFNEPKERNWQVWTDDASLKAFQDALP